jgi:hypothetical protein
VIAGIYLIGLIFLVWLKISSAFWLIWELLFLVSVVVVFWVVPALGVALLCWALVGRQKFQHSPRALAVAVWGLAGCAIDALLYFTIAASVSNGVQ